MSKGELQKDPACLGGRTKGEFETELYAGGNVYILSLSWPGSIDPYKKITFGQMTHFRLLRNKKKSPFF